MRNDELFAPHCPDVHAKRLVLGYALQGLLDDRRTYRTEDLLVRQLAVYKKWLAAVRESTTNFECGFYEWLGRECDAAFIFKPGDLVKCDGRYCVVVRWYVYVYGTGWTTKWRLPDGAVAPVQKPWPIPLDSVELKNPEGRISVVNALATCIEPADIPSEVFALACGKAKDCTMLKGGAE